MIALFAQTVAGHVDLADFLFLIAFICAALFVLVDIGQKKAITLAVAIPAAVACLAAGFWVL